MYGTYIGNERVLVESKVGSKIIVPSSNVKAVSELMCNGILDEILTFFLIKNLKEGNKVLDLGAGFGYFSVLSSALVGTRGKVVSLEENKNNISVFNENIEINNMNNKIISLEKYIKFDAEFISDFDYVRISKEYSNIFILNEIKDNFMKLLNTKFIFEIYDNNIKNTYVEFIKDICGKYQCNMNFIGKSNELKSIDINELENVNIDRSIYVLMENEVTTPIKRIFEDIKNENNLDENIEKLNDIYLNKIEKVDLCGEDIDILNKIAIRNYENGNYNYVIPYLNVAYNLENKNVNTLYNLASVLYNAGELKLAFNYISQIEVEDMDNDILGLKDKIKSELT